MVAMNNRYTYKNIMLVLFVVSCSGPGGAAGVGFVVISKYLYSIESVTVKTSISLHMLTSKSELIWCLVDGNVFGVYACMPYQPSDRPNIIMIKKKRKNQQ